MIGLWCRATIRRFVADSTDKELDSFIKKLRKKYINFDEDILLVKAYKMRINSWRDLELISDAMFIWKP